MAGKARGRRRTRSGDPGRARRGEKELEGERSPRRTSRRKRFGLSAQWRGGEQLGPKGPVPSRGQGPWGHGPASPQLPSRRSCSCARAPGGDGEEEELQLDGGSWRRSRTTVPCAREGAALSWLSRSGMTR